MTEQTTLKVGDTAYLSKYALPLNGEIRQYPVKDVLDGYACVRRERLPWDEYFKIGKEIHATEAEAIAACEKARDKRVESLRKQLDALAKIEFWVKEDQQ